ncbi:MAG: hypothetical protein M3680_12460 [Myxococcota bacterium]|nr:hypothetical protein [Myxococcota bacterium]
MGIFRACAFVSLSLVTAACGGGDDKPVDAMIIIPIDAAPDAPPDAFEQTFDLSCVGNSGPTTAPANIMLGGSVSEVAIAGLQPTIQPSHAATVDACVDACMDADRLDTKTTAASGCPATGCAYASGPVPTGGVPFAGYLRATKTGNRPTYVYAPTPLNADQLTIPILTFTDAAFGAITGFAMVTQDPTKGNMLIAVVDCMNNPISDTANIVLSIKQGGVAVAGTTELNLSSFGAQLAGTYAVFNVPAGATEIGATYKGTALRAHVVGSVAGATTLTGIRPGF